MEKDREHGPLHSGEDGRMECLPGNAARYGMGGVCEREASPLKGRRVLFLGSSVTYGAASLGEAIPEYFAARLGCAVTKEAVSGTTLVDDADDSYVRRLVDRVDPQLPFALAVVQLSTNDASQNKPLGDVSSARELSAFDPHTVTGAMETIIAYIRQTWNCPIAFYTGSRYASEAYAAMVRRLKELRQKWGVGVLDLWTDDAFNAISDERRAVYMRDPIHPTRAGYREWWCPELEAQLLEYWRQVKENER